MGDIHGNFEALVQCLQRSGFNKKKDRLIQLGDVVDGHPYSYECVEELLTIKNLVAVRGNHDQWFLEFIESGHHPDGWWQGGHATAASYLRPTGREHLVWKSKRSYKNALDQKDIPLTHKRFFRSQVNYFIDEENNCFVHGGFNRQLAIENQPEYLYYWDRDLWLEALNHMLDEMYKSIPTPFEIKSKFNNIFIGHTQTLQWNTDRPMKAFNIYNLDTGAGGKGKLTIMNVDTKQWFQSDSL